MATTDVKPPVFLDTNILIRANVVTAPLHQPILDSVLKLRDAGIPLWISRQVLREYMVVVTRSQTFMNPLPRATVVRRVRYFETRLFVAEDSPQTMANLLTLIENIPMGGKQIHDANIVATMQVYGIRHLFTLNMDDFARFPNQIMLLSLSDIENVIQGF